MILDSNIIIYAAQAEHSVLRAFILEHNPCVSTVSYVEVLGYHNLTETERRYFEEFFGFAELVDISLPVLDRAVSLRQQRKMGLGDALIAGTALTHGFRLVTHNLEDFEWVDGLEVLDPLV